MSGMRGDSENGYTIFPRSIIPENSIGCRSFLLRTGFKDLFSVRAFKAVKLVCAQSGMPGISGKQRDCLSDGFVPGLFRGIIPERRVDCLCFISPLYFEQSTISYKSS